MCAGVYCYYYHSVTKVLDIQRYDILIQSIQAYADYPFNISVRGYIIVNVVTAILGINIFASIATYLSAKINYRVGVLACLSINVLYYIYKIGVNVLHYYTFPGIVTYIDFYGGISVLQICIIVGVVLAGVILNSKVVKLFWLMKDLIYVTKSDIIILIRYPWEYHIGGLHEKCSLAL